MSHKLRHQIPIWQAILLGCIIWWLCICAPVIAWSETTEQAEKTVIDLKDGSVIELTGDTVIRRGKQPNVSVLWSISVKEPQLPLVFENREGLPLLFYFVQKKERYGEFHAIRLKNGQEQWVHPIWVRNHSIPISPIFVKPWIYFGRGIWLEKMDPNDGKIVERYLARIQLRSLQALSDGAIEIHAEDEGSPAGMIKLRFQEGQFSPHIAAPQSLLASLDLFQRTKSVVEDYSMESYLELHRLQREALSSEFVIQWRHFDLQKAEKAYRKAYQADPTNPQFVFYLGLSIYYQHRKVEAEPYFQEALTKSAEFWEESLRLGGLCDEFGFTRWADAFYEQGIARYFQEVPAPPQDVTFIEMFVHFRNRNGSIVFANGQIDRGLHMLEVRREIFPYTEWDNFFSGKYVRWLRRMGEEDKAALEEERIGRVTFWHDFLEITPGCFLGFLFVGALFFGVIILRNEIPLFIALVTFFRKNKTLPFSSQWRMLLGLVTSSYIVILLGLLGAYYLGHQISRSPLGGKATEILCIIALIGIYHWSRRNSKHIPGLRNFKLFVCVWMVLWCHLAWFHYYDGLIVAEGSTPIPWIDRGHPLWVAQMAQGVEEAVFRTRDLLFLQALVHQLHGDIEFAQQTYGKISKDVRALNNLGVMLLKNDPQEAQNHFEQALKLDPDFAPALYNLGVRTGERGLIEQARNQNSWRVNAYQKYAPDKPWIIMPTIREWTKIEYWSRGGFPVRGFSEILFALMEIRSKYWGRL